MIFEWDPRKDAANRRKHRVSFSDAMLVFSDPLARIFSDPDHSDDEHREIIVGYSAARRLLYVSFTERAGRLRIISARSATNTERKNHEESQSDQ
jgi:uncharacterized DUF497 family protein